MTAVEMQEKVERVTKTLDIPKNKLLSDHIYSYLNDAKDTFIRETFEREYEKAQPRLDDLRTLITTDHEVVNLTQDATNNSAEGDLPSDYLFLISDRSQTTYCDETKVYPNILVKSEHLHRMLTYSFSKPEFNSPISNIHGAKIRVFHDGNFTIDKVYIDYIKVPAIIDPETDCDLPVSAHMEVVTRAINAIIERYDPQRLQNKIVKDAVTKDVTT